MATDHWSQDFDNFKTHYCKGAVFPEMPNNLGIPENAVFTKSELQDLLNLPNVTHLVFYPIRFEPANGAIEQLMVAIAINNSGQAVQRVRESNKEYRRSIHNCPPNCRGANILFRKVNLTMSDSID